MKLSKDKDFIFYKEKISFIKKIISSLKSKYFRGIKKALLSYKFYQMI